jgi:transposase-like protein
MPKDRRRTFTPQSNAQIVLEVLSGLKSQAEVTRQHKLKPELIARWKNVALERLESLFEAGEQRDHDLDRNAELERTVGRLTVELDVEKASALLPSALRRDGRSRDGHQPPEQYRRQASSRSLGPSRGEPRPPAPSTSQPIWAWWAVTGRGTIRSRCRDCSPGVGDERGSHHRRRRALPRRAGR